MITVIMSAKEEETILRAVNSAKEFGEVWVYDTDTSLSTISSLDSSVNKGWVKWEGFAETRNKIAATFDEPVFWLDADETMHKAPACAETEYKTRDTIVYDHGWTWGCSRIHKPGQTYQSSSGIHNYKSGDPNDENAGRPQWLVIHHADGYRHRNRPTTRPNSYRIISDAFGSNDPRTVYYGAQEAKDVGDIVAAKSLYRKRTEMGGNPEQIYHSMICLGYLTGKGIWLLDAVDLMPFRAEALWQIVVGNYSFLAGDYWKKFAANELKDCVYDPCAWLAMPSLYPISPTARGIREIAGIGRL